MTIKNSILALSSSLLFIGCGGGGGDTVSNDGASQTAATTGASSGSVNITNPNPYPSDILSNETITLYLNLINAARSVQQDCGIQGTKPAVPALTWSNELYGAASEHSVDMAESNTFAHAGSGTSSDWTGVEYGKQSTSQERTENNGYQNWKSIGENITAGTIRDTAKEAIDAWIESDNHCAILMSAKFTEVGMALVEEQNSEYIYYWTQNFAAPSGE